METIIARNSWCKIISGAQYGQRRPVVLEVEAELVSRDFNDYPYYSITGQVKTTDRRYRDPVITCGAIHDTILKYFPNLAPLVEVHLSAPDGVPMHAEANARYWAGLCTYPDGSPMGEYKRRMLAQHLRVSLTQADEIREAMASGLSWDKITAQAGLIELWSNQAGKARALLV